MLFWESKLIHKLRGKSKRSINFQLSFWVACVPGLYYVGTDTSMEKQHFHVMVMDLLGPSLEDLFQACKRQFDLKTVLLVGIQMVNLIKVVKNECRSSELRKSMKSVLFIETLSQTISLLEEVMAQRTVYMWLISVWPNAIETLMVLISPIVRVKTWLELPGMQVLTLTRELVRFLPSNFFRAIKKRWPRNYWSCAPLLFEGLSPMVGLARSQQGREVQ